MSEIEEKPGTSGRADIYVIRNLYAKGGERIESRVFRVIPFGAVRPSGLALLKLN